MREGRREAALASSGTRCLAGVRMSGTTFRPEPPELTGRSGSLSLGRGGVRGRLPRALESRGGAAPPRGRNHLTVCPSPSSARGCAPHTPIPEERAHGRVVDARDTSQGRSGPTHPPSDFLSVGGSAPTPPARIARRPPRGRPAPSPWGERAGVRGDSRAPSKAAGAQRRLEGGTISRSVPLLVCGGLRSPHPHPGGACARSCRGREGYLAGPLEAHPPALGFSFCGGGAPTPPARIARRPPRDRPAPSPWGERVGVRGAPSAAGGPCGVSPRPLKPPSRPHAPARIARPAAARAAHGRIGTTASSSLPVAPSRSTKPYALSITGGKARLGFCIAVVASGCARPRRRIGLLGEGEARLGAVGVDAL